MLISDEGLNTGFLRRRLTALHVLLFYLKEMFGGFIGNSMRRIDLCCHILSRIPA